MKFYTFFPKRFRLYLNIELENYQIQYAKGNLIKAWWHLERAHIIAQKYPYEHTSIHFKMLLFGFKTKNAKEVLGQIPRLIFGGVKSFVGKIPTGNPGGANVPPLKEFTIADDLQNILKTI